MDATKVTFLAGRGWLSSAVRRLAPTQSRLMDTTAQMVIASRLTDGRAVFLAADGSWVLDIAAGAVAHDADAATQLLAAAQLSEVRNAVVEPYLIDIRETDGQRVPVAWREAIRTAGPTVRTEQPSDR